MEFDNSLSKASLSSSSGVAERWGIADSGSLVGLSLVDGA